jgi:hypothetical protein
MEWMWKAPTTLQEWGADVIIVLLAASVIGTFWRLGIVIELLREIRDKIGR